MSSSTVHSVLIARLSTDVNATSNANPASVRSVAACRASSRPASVNPTSAQPVKRFSRFQTDSPWRSRTILCIGNLVRGVNEYSFDRSVGKHEVIVNRRRRSGRNRFDVLQRDEAHRTLLGAERIRAKDAEELAPETMMVRAQV